MKQPENTSETPNSDEKLCADAQNGISSAETELVGRYAHMVRAIARPCFLAGGDGEDLIQEGMLGLINAIREYDPGRAAFRTFAALCVRRRIYSAIRRAQGQKHMLLNCALSLEQTALGVPATQDPEAFVIDKEDTDRMVQSVHGCLSRFEMQVLTLYLRGMSYAQMADRLRRPVKSVDNAVGRIRRKLAGLSDSPS